MAFQAKILADSVAANRCRLTTFELTYPRIVHAEFMTHRKFSRNAASSRAIPVEKLIKKVENETFVPIYWGKNQPGMQAEEELSEQDRRIAITYWLQAAKNAVESAKTLAKMNVHKQIVNRLLEPFQWYTVLCTATEYSNFFALRAHPAAQPEIQAIARLMKEVYEASTPTLLNNGEWHLPLTPDIDLLREEFDIEDIRQISVGRCARVSYETHDGVRDPLKDIELCERLLSSGHMSPFEHVATPFAYHEGVTYVQESGNFRGWNQYRKGIPNEHDFGLTARR